MRHSAVFFAVALFGSALDLLTKHLAFLHVTHVGDEVKVIGGFWSFGKTLNPGVIFGIGPAAQGVWLVVSILAVPAILAIFFSVKRPKWILTISLGMILAGTIGNMYDRVTVGAVRDFIKFYYVREDGSQAVWPLFNLADSFICVGVFLLSIEMIFFDHPRKKRHEPSKVPPAAPVQPLAGAGPAVEGK